MMSVRAGQIKPAKQSVFSVLPAVGKTFRPAVNILAAGKKRSDHYLSITQSDYDKNKLSGPQYTLYRKSDKSIPRTETYE